MVMGPSCGLILADLGADVVKVEPMPKGDNTRRLPGSGAGFFPAFNRNKRSLALDLKAPEGLAVRQEADRARRRADREFPARRARRDGPRLRRAQADKPGLIYCSLKGFLSGPYEHRPALDEVVQMMGGLAYMTGPPGRPLRAGASVNDIMGGMFAAIGILAALKERARTGQGQLRPQRAVREQRVPGGAAHGAVRRHRPAGGADAGAHLAWAVYDVFDTGRRQQIFVGVVSDTQWRAFCDAFGLADLRADPALATNPQRVAARDAFMPRLREMFGKLTLGEIAGDMRAVGAAALRRSRGRRTCSTTRR